MKNTAGIHQFLKQFSFLSEDDIRQFIGIGTSVCLDKESFFIRENQICNKVAFLHKGTLRTFYDSSND